jgi:hypothetical protein
MMSVDRLLVEPCFLLVVVGWYARFFSHLSFSLTEIHITIVYLLHHRFMPSFLVFVSFLVTRVLLYQYGQSHKRKKH